MKKTTILKKISLWMLTAALILGAAGCSSAATGGSETLDIDYVGEDGEITEEEVSAESGSLMDWLKNKLSSDKKNAENGREEVQSVAENSALRERYETPEDTEEENTENTDGQQTETGETESTRTGNTQTAPKQDSEEESSELPLPGAEEDEDRSSGDGNTGNTGKQNTVTFTIRCDTAVANGMAKESKWAGIVPADGCILPVITMEFEEGETVFDLLCRVRDTYKLQMEYSGANGGEYIEGINNLYEFDGGRWSGWMYCVNDWYPNYGCGQYVVSAGDVIEWNYTCDLGCDLENGDPYGWGQEWKDTHD